MTRQLTFADNVIDLDAARATAKVNRDAGMAKASAGTTETWRTQAAQTLRDYLETHDEFHVDDWWKYAAAHDLEFRGKAIGPVIRNAGSQGLMVKTGEYRPSVRSHLSVKPVWRSLIHQSA